MLELYKDSLKVAAEFKAYIQLSHDRIIHTIFVLKKT